MKVRISRKALIELVDILIEILHSVSSQKIKLDNFLIRASVLPFYSDETLERRKTELKTFISLLDEEAISKFEYFNHKYLEWLKKYYPDLVSKYPLLISFEEDNSSFEEFEDDEFFDFDSEDVDSNINSMHYDEEDKINAKEYIQEYGFDEDLFLDMQSYLKEYDSMSLFHLELDDEYMQNILEFLHKVIYLLEISVEFKDLASGLRHLEELLSNTDISKLDNNYKKLLKTFIETIFSDIEKWIDEVLIQQTARDIHYLDASLLANIAQIEIFIGDKK